MDKLPKIDIKQLAPTRDYLHEASRVIGNLQLIYLKPDAHLWQYGLEVSMRGIVTQEFKVDNQPFVASLDLIRYKVRLDQHKWALHDTSPAEIYENIKQWLQSKEQAVEYKMPEFTPGVRLFDTEQADIFAHALWWMEMAFGKIKHDLKGGLVSPLLIYPHHFDLSLVWFPWKDERQISLGFSFGDETSEEPYVYLSAYPAADTVTKLAQPKGAYIQEKGFKGAVLPYKALCKASDQLELLKAFAHFSAIKEHL